MQNKYNQDVNTQQPFSTNRKVEISFKDIIREFKLWKQIISKNFIKLLFTGLIGGAIGFVYAYMDKPVYTAKTRFMLKNEGVGSLFGGQMTGLTSLLGGGQMGTPLERTSEVIASDRIVGRALFRPINIRDTIDLVINHYITTSGLRGKWAHDTSLANVTFQSNDLSIHEMNIKKRKAYKIIKNIMTPEKGRGVVQKSFDKKSGVLTISCVYNDEDFAIALSKAIYDELSAFFVEQMTYTPSNNAEVMKRKLDSIKSELDNVRSKFATQTDQSLGLLLQQDKVNLKELSTKEQLLNVMYSEAIRNYETFEFMNKTAVPSIMLIDSPIAPIAPSKKNEFIYLIISFFISYIITFLVIRLMKNN